MKVDEHMYKSEKAERKAYIKFIVSMLKGMSIVRLRQVLDAVLSIANG